MGKFLRVLRLEVSVYNVYNYKPVSNQFWAGGGEENPLLKMTVNSKEEKY